MPDTNKSGKRLIPPSPDEASYAQGHADEAPFLPASDPFDLFSEWLEAARREEPNDPNAMALASVDTDGLPDVRMVLLKDFDADGFVFYTNLNSSKGQQLRATPKASLLFHWKSLRRQVRIRGTVAQVSDVEADAYFATRARASQIGAWASDQSKLMADRFALEKRVAEYGLKFGLGPVPRPDHWSGFRLKPSHIEFWRDRPFRLHERLVFSRPSGQSVWHQDRVFP